MVLGQRWQASVAPFQVLAAGVVFRNAFVMAYCLDDAPGDMRKRMTRDLVFAVAVLVGSILGIRFGLTGVGGGVLGVGLRLGGTALLAHRPYPGFGWMGQLSRRMASRMAAPEIG